jgi:hypothetical protein
MMIFDGAAAGCAVSTSITRACMVVLLGLYMKYSSEHSETFEALQAGFFRYIHKHKKELMLLKDKINHNDESLTTGHSSTSGNGSGHDNDLSDSSINSESNGVEMTDANSSHSEAEHNEDNDDTDTLLASNRPQRDNARSGSFPSLFQTKKNTLLFLSLGIPGGLVLIVELWTFDIATILVSQIGKI